MLGLGLNKNNISSNVFISKWDTTKTSVGSSLANQIKLPLYNGGVYNFTVYWGDGNKDTITAWDDLAVTHTYLVSGIYTIIIDGTLEGFRFLNAGDRLKILSIENGGKNFKIGSLNSCFYGCSNLTKADNLNLENETNLAYTFRDCFLFNGKVNNYDVSKCKYFDSMFRECNIFNKPIDNWNVSEALSLSSIFRGCYAFNQSVNSWNTSKVTNMIQTFHTAKVFNQDLNNWNVSNVNNMTGMFFDAELFNGNISTWDTSKVTTFLWMFESCDSFNQSVAHFNTGSANSFQEMFQNAISFNQDISTWDISNITNMQNMLDGATAFSNANYSAALIAWNAGSHQDNVRIDTEAKYEIGAAAARNDFITNHGWTINDNGAA